MSTLLFIRALPPELQQSIEKDFGWQNTVSAFLEKATSEQPELHLNPQEFLPFIANRLIHILSSTRGEREPNPEMRILSSLHAGDLLWANNLIQKDPIAVQLFDREIKQSIIPALQRIVRDEQVAIERSQELYERLFVATGDRQPGIHHYDGTGPLKTWLYVVAARMGVDAVRQRQAKTAMEGSLQQKLETAVSLTELDYIRSEHQGTMKQAFAEAVASLTPRERNLLRYTLAGMTAEEIGRITALHRVTVAKSLSHIRRTLKARTVEYLSRELKVDVAGAESLLRLLQSELPFSLERILSQQTPSPV